jgi:hypothetical protein
MPAGATEFFVAPGANGNGSSTAPFGRIQDDLNAAQPGDVVTVRAGSYFEALRTARSGIPAARITLRSADGRPSVLVTSRGRVFTVDHQYFTIDGLVLDGEYGPDDALRVTASANGFTLRNSEVRHSGRDAVDVGGASDVLFDGDSIHHALDPTDGRTDAHGIAAGAVHNLTIRNTEIHTFSGDAIQVDPARSAPGWNDVVIDGCKLWLAPLGTEENGFPAGTVPGENAVDTKANSSFMRARITIHNTNAWGFQNGLITNMAAFNLKENVDAVLDGVTVSESEIAFRLRGATSGSPTGASVRVQNAVVYGAGTAFRYEDNIQNLRVWNVTIGAGVTQPFLAAASPLSRLDVRNLLVLGSTLPREAAGPWNLAVVASAFVDAGANDYELAPHSPAIDAGVTIAQVTSDRKDTPRPQGRGYDIGAYERLAAPWPGWIIRDGPVAGGASALEVASWSKSASASEDCHARGDSPSRDLPSACRSLVGHSGYFVEDVPNHCARTSAPAPAPSRSDQGHPTAGGAT